MAKPWMFVLALVLACIAVYILLEVRATGQMPVLNAASATTSPGPQLPPSLDTRRTPGARPHDVFTVPRADVNPDHTEPKPDNDRPEESASQTIREMREQIAVSFAADYVVESSRDRARGLEQRVRSLLPERSLVRNVECRSVLCRIETEHTSVTEFRDFVQRAYMTLDAKVSDGPVFVGVLDEPVQGHPVVAVAYLGRKGDALPAMPGAFIEARR